MVPLIGHDECMFRIKVCGITTLDDALVAAEAGADAVGLNFCRQSPRYVSPTCAATIARVLPVWVSTVGVFVNEPVASLTQIADELALDFVQLHGDEPAETTGQLAPREVIRALRLRGDSQSARDLLHTSCRMDSPPAALLVDAFDAQRFGGTGQTVNWDLVRTVQAEAAPIPIVLAGGLNADNVAQAIRHVQPAGVDVASGVERSPGCKDPALVRRFIEAARRAWEALGLA